MSGTRGLGDLQSLLHRKINDLNNRGIILYEMTKTHPWVGTKLELRFINGTHLTAQIYDLFAKQLAGKSSRGKEYQRYIHLSTEYEEEQFTLQEVGKDSTKILEFAPVCKVGEYLAENLVEAINFEEEEEFLKQNKGRLKDSAVQELAKALSFLPELIEQ